MEVSVMRCTWAALCIAVLVMSGSAEGASLEVTKSTKSDPLYTYDFTLNIINRIFNDSLLNPKSQDYKVMYEEISSALYSVYGCPACDTHSIYQGVKAMTFSNKTGSVVVQATLIFLQGQINSVVIKFLFLQAINGRNEINGFKINPEFTRDIPQSAPALMSTSHSTTPPITPTTTPPITPTTTPPITPTTTPPITPTTTPTITPTTTPTIAPTTTPPFTPTTTPTITPTTTPPITPTTTPTITPTTTPTITPTTTPPITPTITSPITAISIPPITPTNTFPIIPTITSSITHSIITHLISSTTSHPITSINSPPIMLTVTPLFTPPVISNTASIIAIPITSNKISPIPLFHQKEPGAGSELALVLVQSWFHW
ncbi:hypothetical protein Q7C36_003913 [Tachysurus vachellii]|uniref:SEA domain-containing protein n=1 Tax=Tachysurus vachellii TaxID=175792 RepID=A0AA88NWG3_TACVA|nr:hypothetical protein Q7C36_003913 [Tachysurus vachellii]